MARFPNFFAFVIIVFLCICGSESLQIQDSSANLTAIGKRIQSQQAISPETLNDIALWKYIQNALQITGDDISKLSLKDITWNVSKVGNTTELIVKGTCSLWKLNRVTGTFIFYFHKDSLYTFISFDADLSAIPVQLIPLNAQSWFKGLSLTGKNQVAICSGTFTDIINKITYSKGLSIIGTIQFNENLPISNSLENLVNKPTSSIVAQMKVVFPLSKTDPLFHFTAETDSTIYFGDSGDVRSNQLVLQLDPTSASLKTTIQIVNLGNDEQTLTFDITADVSTGSGITFTGNQRGNWNNAFGFKWLSFQSLSIRFSSTPSGVSKLSFTGGAAFNFVPGSPITQTFELDLASGGVEQLSTTISAPLATLDELFDEVVGSQPPNVKEMDVNGFVQITISTFAHNGIQTGLTLSGSILINKNGDLHQVLRSMTPTPQNLKFTFSLYIPVFSDNIDDIDFKVAETAPFDISNNLKFNNFQFEFAITPTPIITITTSLVVILSGTPMTFDLSSQIQPEKLNFQGKLDGSCDSCFGLSWLQIADADITVGFDLSSESLSEFSMSGDVTLTFGTPSNGFTLSLGPTLDKFTLSVSILIPNAQVLFQEVVQSTVPLTDEIMVMANLQLSNSGSKPGLLITGEAIINSNGELNTVIRSLSPNSPLQFDVSIEIPVFDTNPQNIAFSLGEKGNLPLLSNLDLTGFTITFDVSPSQKVTLDTEAALVLNKNSQTLHFDLSAILDPNSDLSISGGLKGSWNSPFGVDWLTISDISLTLAFKETSLATLSFQGHCEVTFSDGKSNLVITGNTANNFMDVKFEISDITVVSLEDALNKLGTTVSVTKDLNSLTNTIDVILSTYSDGSIKEGLTIKDEVTISGDTLNKIKILSVTNEMTFTAGIYLPIFGGTNVEITLSISAIKISSDTTLTGVTFRFDTTPLQVSVNTGLNVIFHKNQPLDFLVGGEFSADGTVALYGDLQTDWIDVFGFSHFDIYECGAEISFNPAFCAVDLCINGFGVALNLSLGNDIFDFYGFVEVPDLAKVFFEAGIVGKNAYGLALSFQSVLVQWDKMVGSSPLHIDPNDVPADWGLKNVGLYIAPEDGYFMNKYYPAGFRFSGGFRLIGIDCDVNVNVLDDDFDFGVHIDVPTFEKFLKKELHIMIESSPEDFPSWTLDMRRQLALEVSDPTIQSNGIVDVKNVTISDWSLVHLAESENQNPVFRMDYAFLGHHHFTTKVPLLHWYKEFHNFFEFFLKVLFH